MSDLQFVAGCASVTVSSVVWASTCLKLRLAAIHASLAETAAEFVMIEKAAKPRRVKAHKSPAPPPFGL